MAEQLKLGGHTTVDIDDLSGDEPGLVRHKEEREIGDVFGITGTIEYLEQVEGRFEHMSWSAPRGAGRDYLTGANAVDPDFVLASHARGVPGKGVYARFRDVV